MAINGKDSNLGVESQAWVRELEALIKQLIANQSADRATITNLKARVK